MQAPCMWACPLLQHMCPRHLSFSFSTFRVLFWLMNATMKPVISSVTPCGLLLMQCRAGAPSDRGRNGTGADGRQGGQTIQNLGTTVEVTSPRLT
jgi:hypothetical protein